MRQIDSGKFLPVGGAMNGRTDIVIYNEHDHPTLAVEIKTQRGDTVEWAIQLRRNMLAHGTLPPTEYFLLALPNRFYLWKNSAVESTLAEPDFVVNPKPLLAPYFKRAGVAADTISSYGFELIMVSWLTGVMYAESEIAHIEPWLAESGLLHAIAGGRLAQEALA